MSTQLSLHQSSHWDLGRRGEQIAVDYLVSAGFEILKRNWRSAFAEVDIVAKQEKLTVFCEVKTRKSGRFGQLGEVIDGVRISRLSAAAEYWLSSHPGQLIRLDAILIRVNGAAWQLTHLRDICG